MHDDYLRRKFHLSLHDSSSRLHLLVKGEHIYFIPAVGSVAAVHFVDYPVDLHDTLYLVGANDDAPVSTVVHNFQCHQQIQ